MTNIKTTYVYQGDITPPEKETITQTVQYNLDHKMNSYLAKIKKSDTTDISLKVTIAKNRKSDNSGFGFNAIIVLGASGIEPLRYEREWFSKLTDLINHAFDHFKETLASK